MSFFLFLPFTILCVYTGACEETSGKKENVKCSAAFLLRKYICQNQNIASCTALQKIWHGKFLWYFIAASLTTNIFGECYLHVAFLNVSLWTKKRKGFWRKGMPVILPPDLVWKPDCFSDIQAPEAAESQTTVLYPTALMFEEFILFFKSWNFSLKQAETIRIYKLLSFIPVPQAKEQEGAKKVAGFQDVSDSEVHDFPLVSSVHSSWKYLAFCVSSTTFDVCFSRWWPSNGCNYAHYVFLCDNVLLVKLLSWAEMKFWLRRSLIHLNLGILWFAA